MAKVSKPKTKPAREPAATGYKGFMPDFRCQDLYYQVGKTYRCRTARLCQEGFHFCERPLDVLQHYSPGVNDGHPDSPAGTARFARVAARGVANEADLQSPDSKRVATRLRVAREIGMRGLLEAAEARLEKVRTEMLRSDPSRGAPCWNVERLLINKEPNQLAWRQKSHSSGCTGVTVNLAAGGGASGWNTGDVAVNLAAGGLAAGGYGPNTTSQTAAVTTAHSSAAVAHSTAGAAVATGDGSLARAHERVGLAAVTGPHSAALADAPGSAAVSLGGYGLADNQGEDGLAAVAGRKSSAIARGPRGLAVARGDESAAAAELGGWLVLCEVAQRNGRRYLRVQTRRVDGKRIQPNVLYRLRGGKVRRVGLVNGHKVARDD